MNAEPGDLDEITCPRCEGRSQKTLDYCDLCDGEGTICGQCNLPHSQCDCNDFDDEDWDGDWDDEDWDDWDEEDDEF